MKVIFLTLDEAIALHADQIERYGERSGIRDLGLLQFALGVPSATFEGRFLHEGLHEMAAAYLFHVVRNHPFVDGSKRVGLMILLAVLGLNSRRLAANPQDLEHLVQGIAGGRVSKAEAAVFVQQHLRPRSGK